MPSEIRKTNSVSSSISGDYSHMYEFEVAAMKKLAETAPKDLSDTLSLAESKIFADTISPTTGNKNLSDTFAQTENSQKEVLENDLSKLPDSEYKRLLLRFPDILKLSFKEEFTKNGILHRINTGDNRPCRAKSRPLLPGSPKEIAAKKAFEALMYIVQ